MMMKLKVQDQNQEEDIREAFKVFDNVSPLLSVQIFTWITSQVLSLKFQDGNGLIDRRELALMMRFSGEAVSEQEIEVTGWKIVNPRKRNPDFKKSSMKLIWIIMVW